MTGISDLKKRLTADPEFQKEYAEADAEYSIIEALVRARQDANSSNTEPMQRRSAKDA